MRQLSWTCSLHSRRSVICTDFVRRVCIRLLMGDHHPRRNGSRPYTSTVVGNGAAAAPADVVTEATAEVVAEAVPLTRVLVGPPGPDRVEIEMDSEGLSDPCEWGQLDSCAADRITSSLEEAEIAASAVGAVAGAAASQSTPTTAPPPPVSTAGTPYSSPGGRWKNFQKYSTFQVRRAAAMRTLLQCGCGPKSPGRMQAWQVSDLHNSTWTLPLTLFLVMTAENMADLVICVRVFREVLAAREEVELRAQGYDGGTCDGAQDQAGCMAAGRPCQARANIY